MSDNEIAIVAKATEGILKKPGDSLTAYVTPKGHQVVKVHTEGGKKKQSAIRYASTGTTVITTVNKPNQ